MQRVVVGFILLWAFALAATPAQAQDPRAGIAQSAARSWLVLIDQGDVEGSWKVTGAKFKESYPLEKWKDALTTYRTPFGAFEQRAAIATSFNAEVAGLPPGDYANVQFRTTFANKVDALESISLERESDGTWRVIGYSLR